MPLQKLQFRPGINREGTDYANTGGWYDCNNIRFRSGFPEKLGGWAQLSPNQFLGHARALWAWVDLASNNFIGVGTQVKYYIYNGGVYNDITPIVQTDTLTNPFTTTSSSAIVTVTDGSYSPNVGDYVLFSGASTVGGLTLNGEYVVTGLISATQYQITAATTASSGATGGGTVTTQYEYPSGLDTFFSGNGWGIGPWGGVTSNAAISLGTNPFATINGSATITVTQTAHGLSTGNYVIFSGATTFAGIPAVVLNNLYSIVVTGTNTYTIAISTIAGSLTANTTTSGGGSSITVLDQTGSRGWGTAYSGVNNLGSPLRLWSNDNYGQDLVIAPRGGPIYYWADSTGVSSRAVSLVSLATSTTSTSTTATFTSGVTSITVSNPASIYAGAYITGTGIPANTYVLSTYTTGSTTVPISATTTANSSGSYGFSYSGSAVPIAIYQVITSAIQEFVIAFGANPYGSSTFNPMCVRWSDQANAYQWVPNITNQSGDYILTNGSYILGARSTRQEILIWTDSALYSMQYIGAPYVWGFQIMMDNISTMSPNCMVTVNNVTYWMGLDKFYIYTGSVATLPCAVRQYVFENLNQQQSYQVFAGANEAFNEVWWFYCSNGSTTVDSYVIYNYLDRVWYFGEMARTAWLQNGLEQYPVAACYNTNSLFTGYISGTTLHVTAVSYGSLAIGQTIVAQGIAANTTITALGTGSGGVGTYTVSVSQTIASTTIVASNGNGILVNHETGTDDNSTPATFPIDAYVQSSDFEIGDGHNFGFVWRILPDVNFNGSTADNPLVTMTVKPRQNSGSAYGPANSPQVQSANNYAVSSEYNIQQFTGEVYTRLRGRQMSFRIESDSVGTAWQLGIPRIDIRPDGRR
jgi:hypothetical protein